VAFKKPKAIRWHFGDSKTIRWHLKAVGYHWVAFGVGWGSLSISVRPEADTRGGGGGGGGAAHGDGGGMFRVEPPASGG